MSENNSEPLEFTSEVAYPIPENICKEGSLSIYRVESDSDDLPFGAKLRIIQDGRYIRTIEIDVKPLKDLSICDFSNPQPTPVNTSSKFEILFTSPAKKQGIKIRVYPTNIKSAS